MSAMHLLDYGTYIPQYRLQRSTLGKGAGSRSVAGYDEDAITLGVAALRQIAADRRSSQPLYLATTTPPYWDKSNAGTVAIAARLGHHTPSVDLAGLRSGMDALRIASSSGGLAVSSDLRTGRLGSLEETEGGDGAAAFLFGHASGDQAAVAEVLGQVSLGTELMDIWRKPGATWASLAEERFAHNALEALVQQAIKRLTEETGVSGAPSHVLVSALSSRFALSLAKGLTPQGSLEVLKEHRDNVGYCGAADPGLLLAAALDQAQAGDTVLLVCAAGGVDAMLLRVLRNGVKKTAKPSMDLDYVRYLTWRGLLEREPARRPERSSVSSPASYRNQGWKFGLVGSRCTVCATVHLPSSRICSGCSAVDQFEPHDVTERAAQIASFSTDLVSDSPAPPAQVAVVDFEGGGRVLMELAEAQGVALALGTPVQMTFRRTYQVDGTPNYFWKAMPFKPN
jgi:hydroxymethylglutaryl-CoA synthase